MERGMNRIVMGWRLAGGAAALLMAMCGIVSADDQSSTTRPILDELNRETQSLFKQSSPAIVRVEFPASSQIIGGDDPLVRWEDKLDPDVRRKLQEMEDHGQGQMLVREDIVPATSPADGSATTQPHLIVMQLRQFVPNTMGVVIDDQQHVVVAHYLSQDDAGDSIPVLLSDGRIVSAKYVGSDRPTQMTVLQLQDVTLPPAVLGQKEMPDSGGLVMVMSINPGLDRLAVWQGAEPEMSVVVTLGGEVAGFASGGQFMSAARFGSIARQIIHFGRVQRAFLGVAVSPVGPNDPQRRSDVSLGDTSAVRINGIVADSVAEKAGLQAGDLILRLADQPVGDVGNFAAMIADRRGKTDLLILREGRQLVVSIDLEVQP
jgi:S1-C subfamily serine protease